MPIAEIPEAFEGLFEPHRYKVYYGGRGGAKSQTFAIVLLMLGMQKPIRVLCAREVQKSIRDSVKRMLDDEIDRLEMRDFYTSTEMEIRGRNGSLFIFSGLQNPVGLKSLKGITHCWLEEAETLSERSLDIIGPTIREEGSEIWISFNPDRVNAPVWQQFVVNPQPDALVRKVGWQDNPWFPDVLEQERQKCLRMSAEKYDWIWNGNPREMTEGSYYGKYLLKARDEGRITTVGIEPSLLVNTAWDLGVSDSTAIWFFQYLPAGGAGEWRFIDYYEASGEGLPHYAEVLASKGYRYGKHIAPHDIAVRELGSGKSRIETARGLGIHFEIAPNLPVVDGIDAARSVIGAAWLDKDKCGEGLKALWAYQKERDEVHNCWKRTPLHDWTSHGADAFRYAAVGFLPPVKAVPPRTAHSNYNPLDF
jgi:phage terminase large subunit